MRGIERKASYVRCWEWTLKRDATTQCGSRRQPNGCAWLVAYLCCIIVILGGWSVPLCSLSLVDRFLSALPVHALLSTSCSPTPASMSHKCSLAIQTSLFLIGTTQDVMETHNLGPNGGLVYCMDYLEQNVDWLLERLEALQGRRYVLFDFPGQVCAGQWW